ncbi:lipoate--protein ligase [Desulfosporosinus metallidurans]|uniref:lipoate--protein ligase n=1 Tax=Desulfosporosinus metallidurans TaxID=1888891 RepID=A0A1Q8R1B8_9FIRM|nr:lipoate--protein ligase [Desulfosporosinus metallidurans]OLN33220.1 Lipoate-protein ligase A [Desulfosporosinus metallidurans]
MISQIQTRIIKSLSYDPWVNLAIEEYLLEQITEDEVILYLWQNDNTVVIGRNQNAWKECRHLDLERDGGKLARRLSGGGAVFHDLGNLNFTFIMNKKHYDLSKQLTVILQAVTKLGIKAEFSGRNDLVIEEKKFSGNAYFFNKDSALHHGTILINSDLTKLSRYLQVSREKIISKGIDSVQSRVVNLTEVCKAITLADVVKSMEESFCEVYGGNVEKMAVDCDNLNIESLVQKYSSWEWRFGKTPKFDVSISRRFGWGEVEFGFCFKDGYVDAVQVFSDALEEGLIRDIGKGLEGCSFRKDRMIKRLSKVDSQTENQAMIIKDVVLWFSETEF